MTKELNFKQELTAAFGQPISENPTQVMVEAAYRHHDLDWRYLTIEVGPNDLEDAVKGAKVMGFQGFNCTIPHKVKVIDYLDGLGESASLMGAVNCVVRKEGKAHDAYNSFRSAFEILETIDKPPDSDAEELTRVTHENQTLLKHLRWREPSSPWRCTAEITKPSMCASGCRTLDSVSVDHAAATLRKARVLA